MASSTFIFLIIASFIALVVIGALLPLIFVYFRNRRAAKKSCAFCGKQMISAHAFCPNCRKAQPFIGGGTG